ncbi:MAG: hypothetical protein C4314_01965, partial [Thermoflexus sp.]
SQPAGPSAIGYRSPTAQRPISGPWPRTASITTTSPPSGRRRARLSANPCASARNRSRRMRSGWTRVASAHQRGPRRYGPRGWICSR